MASWKKVIVSGSVGAFSNVVNDGVAQHAAVVGGGVGGNQTGVALGAGQLLIGAAGAAPTAATITTGNAAASGSLLVTTGANSLKLEVAGDTISPLNLSGSVADVPSGGETVKISADGKGFVFDAASSVLSAGLGITITDNKISSSIANSATSFGTVPTTEFSGSFTGSLVGLADNATNATNATNVNLSDNEDTDENNVLVFGAGASATGNTALETDGDLTYNPGKSRLSVPQITSSAGFKGDLTGAHNGTVGATSANTGKFTTLEATGNVQLGNATSDTVTVAGNLIVEGTTTEVQTTNLNIEDSLIMLASGSSTADTTAAAKDTGILFAGSRIGVSQDQVTANRGSTLFVDKTYQRLSVLANGTFAAANTTTMTAGAHIPLVTTGSLTSFDQVGNFKVDNAGELFVYAG